VASIRRHGKFIIADLDDGQIVVAHLGMSGRFSISTPGEPMVVHTHAVLLMDTNTEIRFVDPRTFGFLAVFDEDDLAPTSRLGPDAWADPPDPHTLLDRLHGRTAPIKALLLDQAVLAGLGNIYADEVLHHAGVHPLRPGGEIGLGEAERMLAATHLVLAGAIDSGGTTLDDLAYLLPDGESGDNLSRLSVYGREGLDCPRCGRVIQRVVVRGRSTHFCPMCQA
jgi:formamidopyrimidine-DNA glycosylase